MSSGAHAFIRCSVCLPTPRSVSSNRLLKCSLGVSSTCSSFSSVSVRSRRSHCRSRLLHAHVGRSQTAYGGSGQLAGSLAGWQTEKIILFGLLDVNVARKQRQRRNVGNVEACSDVRETSVASDCSCQIDSLRLLPTAGWLAGCLSGRFIRRTSDRSLFLWRNFRNS